MQCIYTIKAHINPFSAEASASYVEQELFHSVNPHLHIFEQERKKIVKRTANSISSYLLSLLSMEAEEQEKNSLSVYRPRNEFTVIM